MVIESATVDVESTCQGIHEVATGWRTVLDRAASGEVDRAATCRELERLARRLDVLAGELWATLETEAVDVLVPADTLSRSVRNAPSTFDPTDALDALEQATRLLGRSRSLRRLSTGRAH